MLSALLEWTPLSTKSSYVAGTMAGATNEGSFLILMRAVTILVGPFIRSTPTILVTDRFSLMFQVIAIGQKLFACGGLKLSRGFY